MVCFDLAIQFISLTDDDIASNQNGDLYTLMSTFVHNDEMKDDDKTNQQIKFVVVFAKFVYILSNVDHLHMSTNQRFYFTRPTPLVQFDTIARQNNNNVFGWSIIQVFNQWQMKLFRY
jgi:hypothetical protein